MAESEPAHSSFLRRPEGRLQLEYGQPAKCGILIAGIEVMHMIRKGQLSAIKDQASSAANQFYSLAF